MCITFNANITHGLSVNDIKRGKTKADRQRNRLTTSITDCEYNEWLTQSLRIQKLKIKRRQLEPD